MTESFNPNDPLFRLSKSLDSSLTDEQRRRLEQELRTQGLSESEIAQFRKADRLVRLWARAVPSINQSVLVSEVLAGLREEDRAAGAKTNDPEESQTRADRRLDSLLRGWAGQTVELDWDRFAGSVMRKVRSARRSDRVVRWVYRVGIPLAAAAAIALAFLTIHHRPSVAPPERLTNVSQTERTIVSFRNATRFEPSAGDTTAERRWTVSFERIADGPEPAESAQTEVGYGWAGASVPPEEEESLPL